jgi:hypothetical protein
MEMGADCYIGAIAIDNDIIFPDNGAFDPPHPAYVWYCVNESEAAGPDPRDLRAIVMILKSAARDIPGRLKQILDQ